MKLVVFLSFFYICVDAAHSETILQPNWRNIDARSEFDEQIRSAGDKLIVVEFFDLKCNDCKNKAPAIDNMALENPDVVMIMVNQNKLKALAAQFNVSRTPTFIFMKRNETMNSIVGVNIDEFDHIIQNSWISVETNDEFDDELENSGNRLVVVEFFIRDESYQEVITPQLEKLPHKYPHVLMIKVNIEKCQKVVERLISKTSSPTFAFLKDGEKIRSFSSCSVHRVEKTINDLLTIEMQQNSLNEISI